MWIERINYELCRERGFCSNRVLTFNGFSASTPEWMDACMWYCQWNIPLIRPEFVFFPPPPFSLSLSLSLSVAEIKRINLAQAKRSVHLLNLLLPVLWCSSRVFDFLGNNKSCLSPASLCSCIHLSIFVPVLFAV